MKIYFVNYEYVDYLKKKEPKVFNRLHERKHIMGVLIKNADFNYFIPLSSPKKSDYTVDKKSIRKSNLTIIRLVHREKKKDELLGTLKINNMIPVPLSDVREYDIEFEDDLAYKALMKKVVKAIRKNKLSIIKNANIIYNQKKEGRIRNNYLNAVVDFEVVEKYCDKSWYL